MNYFSSDDDLFYLITWSSWYCSDNDTSIIDTVSFVFNHSYAMWDVANKIQTL